MLVADVRLELVSASKRSGRDQVGIYFTNYDRLHGWHLLPGWLDGREVLAVFHSPQDTRPGYFVELTLSGDHVTAIRDFRHVPYIGRDASIELATT